MKSILQISLYSEGSFNKDDLMAMSYVERDMIVDIIRRKNDPDYDKENKMYEMYAKQVQDKENKEKNEFKR